MDNRSLSQGTAVILSGYLPYVWHGSLPTTGNQEAWAAAARLWQAVRNVVETNAGLTGQPGHPLERGRGQGVISAANAAAENPSGDTLTRLGGQLAELFDANPGLASQVEAILMNSPFAPFMGGINRDAGPDDLMQLYQTQQQQITEMRSRPATGAVRYFNSVPACQVCGRQDSSLQVVAYPYVMSLLVVTFRRAFSGIWCWRHATLWRMAASVITATVGWLGIPFGVIFTPMALYTLARGGTRPAEINQQMLMDLAQHKLKTDNNPREAVRCLEAALEYGKTPILEARLRELYGLYPEAARSGGAPRLILFPAVLIAAAFIGLTVGVIEYLMSQAFALLSEDTPFLIGMLTWVPLVVELLVGGIIVSQLFGAALARTRTHQRFLGIVLAVMATLIMLYAVPTGEYLIGTIADPSFEQTLTSILSTVIVLGQALFWGGAAVIGNVAADGSTASIIFLGILIGVGILNLISGVSVARGATGRQRLENDFRAATASGYSSSMLTGWLAVLGSVFVCAGLFAVTGIASSFQYGNPAAMESASQAIALLEEGDVRGARAAANEAKAIDPDTFVPYLALSAVELTADNCEEALKAIETAQTLTPDEYQSMIYTYKAESYACMYRMDDAIAALEESVRRDPGSRDALTKLGMVYYSTGDFDRAVEFLSKAVEADPAWSVPHTGLALTYYMTDQPDKEQASLTEALAQLKDESDDYVVVASYYAQKKDFDEAEKHLRKAMALAPNDSIVLTRLASLLANKGDFEQAMGLTDTVLAGQTDLADAYIARADAYVEQEKLDDALGELAHAEALRPDDPIVHTEKARIYFYQGEYQEAITEANLGIEHYKYNGNGYGVLALVYQALDRQEEALAAAQRAVELQPKHDTPHYVLGVYFMKKGDKAAATTEFKSFLDLTWERAYIKEYQAQARAYLAEP